MLAKFIHWALVVVLFNMNCRATASEALWTHQFASESGFPTTLSGSSKGDRKTLVMFWASWCLPCKTELAEIAEHPEKVPPNLRVLAVSVDDPAGMPLAQSFLTSIKWPHEFLRDNSGQFFYEFNRSGQLPFSVLLAEDGTELKTFQRMAADEWTAVQTRTAVAASSDHAPKSIQMSYGVQAEAVDFSGNNNVHNRMAITSAYARFDTKRFSGQFDYDYLYEERNNPTTITRGDEIGFSYLEYHSDMGPGRATVRAGDAHEALLAGELLSLQNFPNLATPASLRGASTQWDQGDFSISGFAGSIHPALFSLPINPTTDLALPVPGETARSASVFWHHEEGTVKNQLSLNLVNYHRDVNLDLGNATVINDQRVGAEYYLGLKSSGLQIRAANFSTNTGTQGIDANRPYIVDPYVWWSPDGWPSQTYSFHYIEYQSLPARTLTPVLVENPALPLTALKIRSFRLSPKFTFAGDSIWFEPQWIHEETLDLAPYERQNSYGFNLSLPKRDQKLLMFFQDGLLSPTSAYQETSLLATSPVYGPLTLQLLLRHHQSDLLAGDSDGLNLGLDLTRIWTFPFAGRVLFSSQWTKQGGYYYGFSGIARSDLFSSHIEWTNGVNSVRLGAGGEPGGIVCTNGVCVQKPPLDGADLEVAVTF